MTESELIPRIQAAVDARFDDCVELTAELVKFPSTFGQEHTAQDFIASELRARGFAVDRWKLEIDELAHLPGFSPPIHDYENAYNVVGAWRAESPKGRSLILNGHIDVVPVGPLDMSSTPPFATRVDGGRLYGRGGGDMKAGLAAALCALDALADEGLRPAADVFVQSVVEEECTGNGALAALARGYRADAVLIPEPVDDGLLIGQLGVIWFQVEVRGRPVHVREAGAGANAIEAAYGLMEPLHGLEARWNERKSEHALFAHEPHPINLNVGRIRGGDWASSVPAWCIFDVRVATYPGQDLAEACAEIEACIRDASRANAFLANSPPEVRFTGFQAEGYELTGAAAPIGALEGAHAAAFGAPLEKFTMTGTTDARFFGLYGDMPALVYGPRSENIHGFDECVDLESLRKVTQAIALFVADWCGLEKI